MAAELIHGYREHAVAEAELAVVAGRVLCSDVEGQADALADAAARLAAKRGSGPG